MSGFFRIQHSNSPVPGASQSAGVSAPVSRPTGGGDSSVSSVPSGVLRETHEAFSRVTQTVDSFFSSLDRETASMVAGLTERLSSAVPVRWNQILRNQAFHGARLLGEELHSWGAPGDTLIQAGVMMGLARQPRIGADHFHAIGELSEPFRQFFWDRTLRDLERRGVPFPREHMRSYDDFIRHMEDNGISFHRRIHSLETAITLVENHRHLSEMGRDRPLAVIIANTGDHNGAFEDSLVIDDLVRSGRFDVVYEEVHTDHEAMSRLLRIHQTAEGRQIDTLMIAGHGSPTSLELGQDVSTDQSFIDVEDFSQGEFALLPNLIAPDGEVLLWACSTGGTPEGGSSHSNVGSINLADQVSHHLPGRTIHATEMPNNIVGLSVTEEGGLAITWEHDAVHVVRTSPESGLAPVTDTEDTGVLSPESQPLVS